MAAQSLWPLTGGVAGARTAACAMPAIPPPHLPCTAAARCPQTTSATGAGTSLAAAAAAAAVRHSAACGVSCSRSGSSSSSNRHCFATSDPHQHFYQHHRPRVPPASSSAADAAPTAAQDSSASSSPSSFSPSSSSPTSSSASLPPPGPAAGLYDLDGDPLLQLLFEHAGLRALDFAPALPHMAASTRYMQLDAANFAAWVSLMTDLRVQRPALVLASCPAFLLMRLTEEGEEQEQEEGSGSSSSSSSTTTDSGSGSGSGSGSSGGYSALLLAPGCGGGGPDYGAAVCRFVGHCRDVLLMREEAVWGLLARLPSLAWLHPGQVDAAIAGLAPVLKGAGRGHRLGPAQSQAPSSTASSSAPLPSTSPPPPAPPPAPASPSAHLTEEEELDAALYAFLARAPAVLCLSPQQLAGGMKAVAAAAAAVDEEEEGEAALGWGPRGPR
ncbi:hypothetical protein CHLRE_04g214433v5 [Chlamydomonas reinhardtii]|uniref:Uncharacterized protein n=1 Tax=Chlamydomonas reinhardtii TaxID=3055 RepID=A0A2K3DT95_CHLRE|nr:uncharacterized protein CHLRE_04g214433v5 [Chlamydomonas reinhardtii]PNW83754.1 hypothetical protein CHLRE_04g214433v5 [Chlamydomonas reinhardtii]